MCDQCKFAIDLTRLEHGVAKADTHLVDMAIGKLHSRGLCTVRRIHFIYIRILYPE